MARRRRLGEGWLSSFKTREGGPWVSLLGEAWLPIGHVLTLSEALADPRAGTTR